MQQIAIATENNEQDLDLLQDYGIYGEIESFSNDSANVIFVFSVSEVQEREIGKIKQTMDRYWSVDISDESAKIYRIDTDEFIISKEIKRESSISSLRSARDPQNRSHFIEEILFCISSEFGMIEPAGYWDCAKREFWDEMISAAQM